MSPHHAPDRRAVLAGAAAALLTTRAGAGEAAYDAIVAKPGSKHPRGKPFDSIAAALAAAPPGGPFCIWLGAGEWREKLTIRSADVTIVGEQRQRSRIRYDAAAGLAGPDGKPWGTLGSATLTVLAPGFCADTLTIENGFDPVVEAQRGGPILGDRPGGQQAVALALGAGGDRARLRHVDILGRQDTLLIDDGRALFEACLVTGTVDFVFGGGLAMLRDCEIRSRDRPSGQPPGGCIAAPSTRIDRDAGLIFDRCRLTAEPGVPDGSVFLGRAWRPTRRFADGRYGDPQALGMAAYIDCTMGAQIAPRGWTEMNYSDVAGARVALQPEQARFFEAGNNGPGAAGDRRSKVVDPAAVKRLRALF